MAESYEIAVSQIIGDRPNQQDAISFNTHQTKRNICDGIMAVICDGMGGYEHGELAAQYASKRLIDTYQYGRAEYRKYLEEMIRQINQEVVDKVQRERGITKCGCTMVCVIAEKGKAQFANVGDSRAYLYRNNKLIPITHDQNLYELLKDRYERGLIRKEELNHPRKDALTNYIGIKELKPIDHINNLELCRDDVILLCSDGLYKSLSDEAIVAIISRETDLSLAAHVLTATAFDSCYRQDNTSVVLIKIKERKGETK